MSCQEIRQQLAVYRELSSAERDRVQEHLATCSSCAATLAAYGAQDQILAAMPVLTPSPALVEAVHARTVGRRRAVAPFFRRRALVALSLVLCLSITWGTMSRAGGALPGDALYPVKRVTEQVRLALSFDPDTRHQYQQALAETRREETGELVRLGRTAQVEFQGELVEVRSDIWQVDGLIVTVSTQAWAGAPPPTGSMLAVEARTANGRLTASRIRVLAPTGPTPEPQRSPTGPQGPSHTPTPRRPSDEPTTGPGPSASPQRTASPDPGPRGSATSGAWGPGPQPTVTPAALGPGPQLSATPGAWGPGPQPSATPGAWGPGPQPSATPGTGGPGPQPSATPGTPEPEASATPVTPEPGPQPSTTTVTPQPSVTPSGMGPGPQPSGTPGAGGPGQPPAATPGPGGR